MLNKNPSSYLSTVNLAHTWHLLFMLRNRFPDAQNKRSQSHSGTHFKQRNYESTDEENDFKHTLWKGHLFASEGGNDSVLSSLSRSAQDMKLNFPSLCLCQQMTVKASGTLTKEYESTNAEVLTTLSWIIRTYDILCTHTAFRKHGRRLFMPQSLQFSIELTAGQKRERWTLQINSLWCWL